MGGRADFEIDVFMRDFQNIEKVIRHFVVIMLARMNEPKLQPVLMLELSDQRSDLHKIGPSAYDQIQSSMMELLHPIGFESWN